VSSFLTTHSLTQGRATTLRKATNQDAWHTILKTAMLKI